MLFDKLPEPFNQVEIGRVSRQKTQLNLQAGGSGLDQSTFLITRIVQEQGDGNIQIKGGLSSDN